MSQEGQTQSHPAFKLRRYALNERPISHASRSCHSASSLLNSLPWFENPRACKNSWKRRKFAYLLHWSFRALGWISMHLTLSGDISSVFFTPFLYLQTACNLTALILSLPNGICRGEGCQAIKVHWTSPCSSFRRKGICWTRWWRHCRALQTKSKGSELFSKNLVILQLASVACYFVSFCFQ